MRYREQVRLLKEAGFTLERRGSRHELWTNGHERIALSPAGASPNTLWSFLSRVRKAKKLMEESKANTMPEEEKLCG